MVTSDGPTSLLTDHYELTMLDVAVASGLAGHRAVFEVFTRRLPPGRRFGVFAGLGRIVESLERFTFGADELAFLAAQRVVTDSTLDWLASYRFTGTITAYREGEPFVPGSPVLTVEAPFGQGLVLETLVLSVLNHDSAIAAAGARMVTAANGRPLLEAGSRRTHEWAAPAASRAAYLVGFAATSNLEAGRRYGVPTGGTAAHALTLAHRDESGAFAAQAAVMGPATTFLVDTFDVETAIREAVRVGAPGPGAIRIDSGDLALEARRARALLDSLGASGTGIVVSGDLDEHAIAGLAGAPIDRLLVGTELVTGSGAPTAGLVYKLVAIADEPGAGAPLRPVAKRSSGKADRGGRKFAGRLVDPDGVARAELLATDPELLVAAEGRVRPLQVPVVESGGEVPGATDLDAARAHHRGALAELDAGARELSPGEAALVVSYLG